MLATIMTPSPVQLEARNGCVQRRAQVAQTRVRGLYLGDGGRMHAAGSSNVVSQCFHEGRGAGKSTTPGGREKNAYFFWKGRLRESHEWAIV